MTEPSPRTAFLIFDVEAVADGDLIARVRYPQDDLTPDAATRRYRDELLQEHGRDVLPSTFVLPIAVAVAKVGADYRLQDLSVLDAPQFRPAEIARRFWQGWRHYGRPTLVTFNGRGYDLPVLELAAFRYGIAIPDWFHNEGPSYQQPRNRYNTAAHIDLMDLITNFGAARATGGLNLLANLIGKPGKTGIDGSQIQDMHTAGRADEINDYCRCDVLDTYFVFLRSRVLLGKLPLKAEQEIVDDTKVWLEARSEDSPAYTHYLQHWGDWQPPED